MHSEQGRQTEGGGVQSEQEAQRSLWFATVLSKQRKVCKATQAAFYCLQTHSLTWGDFSSCMGLSHTAEFGERLWK